MYFLNDQEQDLSQFTKCFFYFLFLFNLHIKEHPRYASAPCQKIQAGCRFKCFAWCFTCIPKDTFKQHVFRSRSPSLTGLFTYCSAHLSRFVRNNQYIIHMSGTKYFSRFSKVDYTPEKKCDTNPSQHLVRHILDCNVL